MKKLQRYWIDGGLCEMEPRGVFAECVHRIYLQDEADAVISALEDELAVVWLLNKHVKEKAAWEAKEKALRELTDRWMDEMESMTTPMRHQSLICSEHASDLLVILNREQEKP